eukprot:6193110-Pleurochrysis_carterae.AAC.3
MQKRRHATSNRRRDAALDTPARRYAAARTDNPALMITPVAGVARTRGCSRSSREHSGSSEAGIQPFDALAPFCCGGACRST